MGLFDMGLFLMCCQTAQNGCAACFRSFAGNWYAWYAAAQKGKRKALPEQGGMLFADIE